MSKKIKKPKKLKNKLPKKPNRKKKPIKHIKILKKLTGLVQFRFYKPETEKPNPNRVKPEKKKNESTRKKSSQAEKTEPTSLNRFCPKNRTELKPVGLNRFWFLKKKFSFVIFFYKNRTESKMITPNYMDV
jgi:hypothetical protein